MRPYVEPGDIFGTRNPMALGKAINKVQRFWSSDGQSNSTHAGFIIDEDGTTSESLWTIARRNIYTDLAGEWVIIGRHEHMTPEIFAETWEKLKGWEGKKYPFWRLLLHLIPSLPRHVNTGKFKVCSEWTSFMLKESGVYDAIKPGTNFKGLNPGQIEDMIYYFKGFKTVFEGVMPREEEL